MYPALRRLTIPTLHWIVGAVLLFESASFAFGPSAAHAFSKTHLPLWLRPALGGVELIAAALFLIPPVSLIGGYALLVILCLAALIHILHGWYDVSALIVYAAAVLACIAAREEKQGQQ
jgi:hypothetical protein